MTKLRWRVKLVAERKPGVTTDEVELACIERDEQATLAGPSRDWALPHFAWMGIVNLAAGRLACWERAG